MKLITVVRHAEAASKPGFSGKDKLLTKKGQQDADTMGAVLKKEGVMSQCVYVSTAVRAVETARRILGGLGVGDEELMKDEGLYNAEAETILDLIKSTDPSLNHIMVCGHNPGVSVFSNLLTNTESIELHTCDTVLLSFEAESWADLTWGQASVEKYWSKA